MKKAAVVWTLLALASAGAAAQTYPAKPIRLLVGFSAGGSADASARALGSRMGQALGTTIVVATHNDELVRRHRFPVLEMARGRLTARPAVAPAVPAMA